MCRCIRLETVNSLRRSHKVYIKKAVEESLKSNMSHRHGACLVHRNKIVAYGYNKMIGGSIKGQKNSKYGIYSIHAEVSAVKEFLRLGKRKGMGKNILKECTLYVVRTGKKSMDFPIKMSKPCDNCYNFLAKHKIKKVYWSEDSF